VPAPRSSVYAPARDRRLVRVPGGTEDERITPLALSPRADRRAVRFSTDEQVEAGLDLLERGQQDDGG